MKKCAKLLLPLGVLACLTLASCELLAAAHTHDFQTEWTNDETHHWQTCKDETCTEITGKAEHDFENDVCSVCGYTLPPKTTVTEEEFYAALSFENVDSVTIVQDGKDFYCLDGNKVKLIQESSVFYMEDKEDYINVYVQQGSSCEKMAVYPESNLYESVYSYSNLLDFFSYDVSFDDFTYENGVYNADDQRRFLLGIGIIRPNMEISWSLSFENAKLVSLTIHEKEDGNSNETVFTVKDYNKTTVTLPTEYTDLNAVTEEEFYAALSFENVDSFAMLRNGEEFYFLENNKVKVIQSEDDVVYLEDHEEYVDLYEEDGTWYKTQVSPEDENYEEYYSMLHFAEFFFGYISFGDFTYENGVYTGSSNTLGNCSLRIEGGQLVALTIYYEEDGNVSSTDFTFTNYNSTTVTLPTEYTDLSGGNS